MLFKKNKQKDEVVSLSKEKAQDIYELFKAGKDETQIFLTGSYTTPEIDTVRDEFKKLENEIISKVSGSYVTKEAVPATYDEEGSVDTKEVPAEYFNVTSKKVLTDSLSSDLLDIDVVCSDTEDYYGEYKESRNFTDFKNLVTN